MSKIISEPVSHIFSCCPGLQSFFVHLLSAVGNFFAKITAHIFSLMFKLQWCANCPENFDHRIDLYTLWRQKHNPLWVERGTFNVLALQMFPKPIVVELCCGDGFYTKYFYSISSEEIYSCDFDKNIIKFAKKNNSAPNIHYEIADIRDGISKIFPTQISQKKVTNIIWDAAIEHFTESEIFSIMKDIKNSLTPDGIVSGYTVLQRKDGKKHLEHHEREFASKEDLRNFFSPYFKNVHIIETHYPDRTNLYFYASDAELPLDSL